MACPRPRPLLEQEPLVMLEVDCPLVLAAAHIKAQYTRSYTDAFVVACGVALQGIIVSGDPEFHSVENMVKVEWLSTDRPTAAH